MLIGAVLVGVVLLAALLAGWLAPFDPLKNNYRNRLGAPDAINWLGTDRFGRDVLSRILFGAQVSLRIGLAVAAGSGLAGGAVGLVAGWWRRLDPWLMPHDGRADGISRHPAGDFARRYPRPQRGQCRRRLDYRHRAAHRASDARRRAGGPRARLRGGGVGGGCWHAAATHPPHPAGLRAPLVVQQTYIFAVAVLAEAVLSYIGVGPPPPTATLGAIIADGRDVIVEAPWVTLFPGMVISPWCWG